MTTIYSIMRIITPQYIVVRKDPGSMGAEKADRADYFRTYREEHREDLNSYHREWTRKNRDKVKEYKQRYKMRKRDKNMSLEAIRKDYDRLRADIAHTEEKIKYWLSVGNGELAEVYGLSIKNAKKRVEYLERVYGFKPGSRSGTPARRSGATARTAGAKPDANAIISGVLSAVERATGKPIATDVIQHVTSRKEFEQWLVILQGMYTDPDGKLDRAGYCEALKDLRESMQCTSNELKEAKKDSKDPAGYDVMISKYEEYTGILTKEIKKYERG